MESSRQVYIDRGFIPTGTILQMNFNKASFLLSLVLMVNHLPLSARQLHVKGNAVDGNGSITRPYASVNQAAQNALAGDTVFIHEGVYRETIRPVNNGTAANPILFTALQGDSVVICGADPVSGWQLHENNIYKVPLSFSTDELYRKGSMLQQARWPNASTDPLQPVFAIMDGGTTNNQGVTNTVVDDQLIGGTGFFDGAKIWYMGDERWWARTGIVEQSSGKKLNIRIAPHNLWWACLPSKNAPYYLYGCYNALDTIGEWYQDSDNTLYIWSTSEPVGIEVKRRRMGFDLREREYIHIKGISFFSSTVNAENAQGCLIDHCDFRYVCPMYSIDKPLYRENVTSRICDTMGGIGVYLGGENNTIKNSIVQGSWGDGITLTGRNNTAYNCLVSDVNYIGNMPSGISPFGEGHRIERCTIHRTGRSGIRFRVADGVITYNEIYDIGRINWDLGGIYSNDEGYRYVSGTEISYNNIHHILTNRSVGPGQYYGGKGIFLDNNSSGVLVHHNLIWKVTECKTCAGIGINWGNKNLRVFNNTIAGRPMERYAHNMEMIDVKVYNNLATSSHWEGTDKQRNIVQAIDMFHDASNGDLRITTNSPAIDAGLEITGITGSFNGAAPDAGAIEFGKVQFDAGYKAPHGQPGSTVPRNNRSFQVYPFSEKANTGMWLLNGRSISPYQLQKRTIGNTIVIIRDSRGLYHKVLYDRNIHKKL